MLQRGVFSLEREVSRALRVKDGPLQTHRVPEGGAQNLAAQLQHPAQGGSRPWGPSHVSPPLSPRQGLAI